MEAIERKLGMDDHECADVLMLLAAVRGGINGLRAEGAGGSHPSAFTAGMVHAP
jgi:hypothetical protein